jgi:hypothetical protein
MLRNQSKSSNVLLMQLKNKKIPNLFLCFFIICLFTSFIAFFFIPDNKHGDKEQVVVNLDLPELDENSYSSEDYYSLKNISFSED